jgi:hypothetical protein
LNWEACKASLQPWNKKINMQLVTIRLFLPLHIKILILLSEIRYVEQQQMGSEDTILNKKHIQMALFSL